MSQSKLILDYVFEHARNLGNQVCMTQPIGDGKVAEYSWAQILDQALRMAAHLQSLNFEPGARIAILSKNCAHFMIAELAIWLSNGTTVAIFPTETAETVRYVLEHSGASLLFVGKLDTWTQQQSAVRLGLPCISFPLAPKTAFPSWDDIVQRTKPSLNPAQRIGSDLAMIIYTSGSTGQPKGVMHCFEAITRAAEGIAKCVRDGIGPGTPLRMLSYLPLAHVVERAWVECASFIHGDIKLYFAETLESFLTDLRRARPTVFVSVPRLWLKFQQGAHKKMPERKLALLLSLPIIGKIVGRRVLEGLGLDHVRMAGSGSAPIATPLIQWYRKLGLNLLEGYGMSEDFAYSNSSAAAGNSVPGFVGTALSGVLTRISDEGEILIKSPGKFVGYYQQMDLYAESFDPDGYFCTGDLGELRADGLLKITGRKKDLFKTGKGKYVAPAPIENHLNTCPVIEASMVSGVGQQAPYALVVIAEDLRPGLNDPKVRDEITETLKKLLVEVNKSLADYEQLHKIVVANVPFSIANGCLTPTLKIKRNRIEALVAPKLDGWYREPDAIVWAK